MQQACLAVCGQAIVQASHQIAHMRCQAGRLQWRSTGFHEKFVPVYLSRISTARPTGNRVALFSRKRCIRTHRMHRPGFAVCITLNNMDEIIGGVLGVIAIQTGRAVVWFVSFGKWRGEPLLGDEGRIYGAAGALSFIKDGRRVITDTGLLFFGIAFYVLLFAVTIAFAAAV